MRIKSFHIISFVLLLVSSNLYAQQSVGNSLDPQLKKKKRIPRITEELSLGGRLNSDGWGVFAERGVIKSNGKTSFVYFGISEKKHPKESKVLNETFTAIFPNEPIPLPYKYGKINNFYQVKMGYGQKKQITGKLDKKSVLIHWVYSGALSLGFLKPYHLDVLVPEGNNTFTRELIDYNDESLRNIFLDEVLILGGGTFIDGLDALKVRPGISARTGFYFDYAASRKSLTGIEIGTSLEVYPGNIPIMAVVPQKFYFLNLYADVRFGKRWAKSSKRRR